MYDYQQINVNQLGKENKIKKEFDKYKPKKDLSKKAADYLEKYLSVPAIDRVDTCSNWMHFLTDATLTSKRLARTQSCGNRFCPICLWKKARKDAIKISVVLNALKKRRGYEYLFLTLTAPTVTGDELRDQINRFNHAVYKLFLRRKVGRMTEGYIRKLEVTTDQNKYITDDLYKRKKDYYDYRGLGIGDPNPTYNTYHPHMHIIIAVKRSYFNDTKKYISKDEWLKLWQDCMQDTSITQINIKKANISGRSNAVIELAKYTAKGSDMYHSEPVFDVFYKSLKRRQLIVYSKDCKEYAKMYENGELDAYKDADDNIYTHLLKAIWKNSNYEKKIRELTPEEYEIYNERALKIDESDDDDID